MRHWQRQLWQCPRPLTRKSSGEVHLALSYLSHVDAVDSNCQILFIDASERARANEILKKAEKLPILTVTDSLEAFQAGAMIGLFADKNRMAFEVNYNLVQNAKLSMSSKLLHAARKVAQ